MPSQYVWGQVQVRLIEVIIFAPSSSFFTLSIGWLFVFAQVVIESFNALTQQLRGGRAQAGEARNALESHKKRGHVLQHLIEQRDTGNIPGIYGRLVRDRGGKGLQPV